MSIHLSTALLAHLFSYDMTWGSTGKEVEQSSFWIEVPRIWQRFKLSFCICFACIAMMIVFTTEAVPFEWQIPGWNWALVIPLSLVVGCHILVPVRSVLFYLRVLVLTSLLDCAQPMVDDLLVLIFCYLTTDSIMRRTLSDAPIKIKRPN